MWVDQEDGGAGIILRTYRYWFNGFIFYCTHSRRYTYLTTKQFKKSKDRHCKCLKHFNYNVCDNACAQYGVLLRKESVKEQWKVERGERKDKDCVQKCKNVDYRQAPTILYAYYIFR